MEQKLIDIVKSNLWFKVWNFITKESNILFFRKYMVLFLIVTILSLFNFILIPSLPILIWVNIIMAIPFVVFAFVSGLVHFMVGNKIQKLSKEFGIPFYSLRSQIHKILNG